MDFAACYAINNRRNLGDDNRSVVETGDCGTDLDLFGTGCRGDFGNLRWISRHRHAAIEDPHLAASGVVYDRCSFSLDFATVNTDTDGCGTRGEEEPPATWVFKVAGKSEGCETWLTDQPLDALYEAAHAVRLGEHCVNTNSRRQRVAHQFLIHREPNYSHVWQHGL